MSLQLTWTGIGIILAVIAHAIVMIRSWAFVEAKLSTITTSLIKLDKELEKRDAQIAAAWKKIDDMRERLTIVETKVSIHNKEEE